MARFIYLSRGWSLSGAYQMYYVLGTESRQFWLRDLNARDSLEHGGTRISREEQSFAYFRLNLLRSHPQQKHCYLYSLFLCSGT